MAQYQDSTLAPEVRAADLLRRMTLREKVGQLTQRLYGFACYRRVGDQIELTEEFQAEVARYGGLGRFTASTAPTPGRAGITRPV